ncbi:ECF-type sigma factor [Paludibaculum fermentans]|uniref:ECF-type sigma factor n=1 Tax=Paludibaculum fermentans TaxID=1473598 RepID=UPI003EBF6ADD
MGVITQLLENNRNGTPDALDRLLREIYPSIRGLAGRMLRKESEVRTLQPTALAHEFVLSLLGGSGANLENRGHLMAIAALEMRRTIAKHAVKRRKHLVDLVVEPADEEQSSTDQAMALTLEHALLRLESMDPRACKVVEMRFFGGLSAVEIASELGVARKTVQRDWAFASTWLSAELGQR